MATVTFSQVATNKVVSDGAGTPLPIYAHQGVRVNGTATVASTAEAALPLRADGGASTVIEIRSADYFWIRFGLTGLAAAAADANAILWTPGSGPIFVPVVNNQTATHFRAIRFGASDVTFQIESIA